MTKVTDLESRSENASLRRDGERQTKKYRRQTNMFQIYNRLLLFEISHWRYSFVIGIIFIMAALEMPHYTDKLNVFHDFYLTSK